MDPTDPTGFAARVIGLIVAITAVLFAYNFASNRGVRFVNRYASKAGLSTSGQESDPWGGW